MQHVAHPVPATWRGGTSQSIPAIASRVNLRARAVRLYQQLTAAPEALPALRAQGARILALFWKARSATQTPSADMNTARYIAESVPAQIRVVQQKMRELDAARTKYRAELDLLLETAVLHGVELCPTQSDNGNAAGPGGADGASIRGVIG